MCTAFSVVAGDHYFGRNLDLDYHYNEEVTITPRGYHFPFRHTHQTSIRYAMVGIATVIDEYPLYYEAVNEKGLSMAGLNFPGNAVYHPLNAGKTNIASFELIPWILRQCETVSEARSLLQTVNLCETAFRDALLPTPLHWIIADSGSSITVEPMPDGIKITDNPVGILTNNPPFSYHSHNLTNYINLTACKPVNRFSENVNLQAYSLGMGAIGLPGDFSSASRFVRCAFIKENSVWGSNEEERISQMFHILDGVSQFDGCVEAQHGYEKTLYSICCNTSKGIFYYTTYHNRQITAIDMYNEALDSDNLITFPLISQQQINRQN